MTINDLAKGVRARVLAIAELSEHAEKIRQFGFSEGDEVEVLEFGPLGGQPLAVRLNRSLVALRSAEAAAIEIEI